MYMDFVVQIVFYCCIRLYIHMYVYVYRYRVGTVGKCITEFEMVLN